MERPSSIGKKPPSPLNILSLSHPQYLECIEPSDPLLPPPWITKELPTCSILWDVYHGHLHVQTIRLTERSIYLIGRNPAQCEIVLDHNTVSRRHSAIGHHSKGGTYIMDLGSGQGTIVEREKLRPFQPTLIQHGHRIQFGASPLHYIMRKFENKDQLMLQWTEEEKARGSEEEGIRIHPHWDVNTYVNTMLNRYASYRMDSDGMKIKVPHACAGGKRGYRRMSTLEHKQVSFQETHEIITEIVEASGDLISTDGTSTVATTTLDNDARKE